MEVSEAEKTTSNWTQRTLWEKMSLSATDLQKKISNGKGPLTPKKLSSCTFDVERTRVEDESEIEKKYQMGEVLGKGAFGVVKEVVHRDSKARFAMKIVPKDKVCLNCTYIDTQGSDVMQK